VELLLFLSLNILFNAFLAWGFIPFLLCHIRF